MRRVRTLSFSHLDTHSLAQGALEADPDRIAVPERAGLVHPEEFLKGTRGAQFCALDELAIPGLDRSPDPVPCYMVAPHKEKRIRGMLLSKGMAMLIQEDVVARRLGGSRLLLGRGFCVARKQATDRLIFGRRPRNAGEKDAVAGPSCPSAPCSERSVCELMKVIEGQATTYVRTYFCQLRRRDSGLARNAFGRRIAGGDVA